MMINKNILSDLDIAWTEVEHALQALPKKQREQRIEKLTDKLNRLSGVNDDGYEPPPLPMKAPELYQGMKKSGSAIEFLGRVYGQWLVHFNPRLKENHLSAAQLKALDKKLYKLVSTEISNAKKAGKTVESRGIVITQLGQLIAIKLSSNPLAVASRLEYAQKKSSLGVDAQEYYL